VKFTVSRKSLTALSVDTVSLQCGHLTGVSSRYTASNFSGWAINPLFGRYKQFLYLQLACQAQLAIHVE